MKSAVVSLLLLCLCTLGFAHINPLEKYDFTSGEYALFLIAEPSFSKDGTSREAVGYTQDPAILQKIQQAWTFDFSRTDQQEPATHYFYLHKAGEPIARFRVCLGEELMYCDRAPVKFSIREFSQTQRLLTPFQMKNTEFQSLEAARTYHQRLQKNDSVLYLNHQDWVTYEGTFRFSYRIKDAGRNDPLMNTANAKSVIDSLFRRKYPHADFKMSSSSTSQTLISLSLLCHPKFASTLMAEPLTWSWQADTVGSPFEGSFWVGYRPAQNESIEAQVATATAAFQSLYPDVPFELSYAGSHSKNSVTYTTLEIKTTRSILESFNLYPRGITAYTPLDQFWVLSYWLEKSE